MSDIAIVIPARYASTRLPGKMLLSETRWELIRHVYEQAKKSQKASNVLIATDDDRIAKAVKAFGGDYVMTDPKHPTGTDRLAEVATKYLPDAEMIVNVQGDEPEIEPANIDALIDLFSIANAEVGTLVSPFPRENLEGVGSPLDPACVKAVLGAPIKHPTTDKTLGYQALYFSRGLIPYHRDQAGKFTDPSSFYMHLGIYAYRPEFLKRYVTMPQGRLEMIEKLEQLRVLENGYKIVAGVVARATPGIDTRADYDAFVGRWKKKNQAR